MKITTHTKKWTNTVATIVIGTTMFFGIKQAHKEYELLNPIIKIFTENPSQKFSEIYLSFKKERLDQEKKQNLEEFIKKNKEKIDLYRSELENITNISEEKNYSEKILRYIENQSKFSNVLKEYYKDTTTTGFSDKLINSKEDYYNLSKQILKNLNKKFRVTEEGIKYLSKGKEQLEKRKRYLDDITKLEVTRDLEARGTILEEYYSDTTKNKEIYDWIETRTLRNLGYNNIQIKNIKNNGFESKEISERIKQKISFMIELTEFYKLINQENEDPLFIKAVIMQESKFDNNAKSHAGAEGFMQLMPETAKQYNVNKNNPIQNIVGGTRMLSKLKYKYSEYTPTTQKIFTLIGYNWGPRNVSRFMKYGLECLPKETAKYVPYVLGYEAELNKIYTL